MIDLRANNTPQVIDFEAFAAQRGASRLDYCDDGAVSPAGHMPKSNWRRQMKTRAERNAEQALPRAELCEGDQVLIARCKSGPLSRVVWRVRDGDGRADIVEILRSGGVIIQFGVAG